MYQATVCIAQQKEIGQCKYTALKQIRKLNLLGTIKSITIQELQNERRGVLKWHFYKRDFFFKQTLNLPQ